MAISEDLAAVREDVAFIKAKIEALPDHENRIRTLEKWRWQIPSVGVVTGLIAIATATAAVFGIGGS